MASTQTTALEAGILRVKLAGELDIAAAPRVQHTLEELIRLGHDKLLIDLSEATFVDSTMLGVLLRAVRRLRRRRGALAVFCPDPAMRGLFELVGHNLIFPVEQSPERALSHLGVRPRSHRSARGPRSAGADRSPQP